MNQTTKLLLYSLLIMYGMVIQYYASTGQSTSLGIMILALPMMYMFFNYNLTKKLL